MLLKSVVWWNMMLGQLTVRSWHLEGMWFIHIQGHVVKFLLLDHSPHSTVSYPGTVEFSLQYCPVVYRVTVCEHKYKLGSVNGSNWQYSSLQYILITLDSCWTSYVCQWCYHCVTDWARIALAKGWTSGFQFPAGAVDFSSFKSFVFWPVDMLKLQCTFRH